MMVRHIGRQVGVYRVVYRACGVSVGYGCRTSYRRLWGVVEGDAVGVTDSWRVTAE